MRIGITSQLASWGMFKIISEIMCTTPTTLPDKREGKGFLSHGRNWLNAINKYLGTARSNIKGPAIPAAQMFITKTRAKAQSTFTPKCARHDSVLLEEAI
jgi:hypothetical protein